MTPTNHRTRGHGQHACPRINVCLPTDLRLVRVLYMQSHTIYHSNTVDYAFRRLSRTCRRRGGTLSHGCTALLKYNCAWAWMTASRWLNRVDYARMIPFTCFYTSSLSRRKADHLATLSKPHRPSRNLSLPCPNIRRCFRHARTARCCSRRKEGAGKLGSLVFRGPNGALLFAGPPTVPNPSSR